MTTKTIAQLKAEILAGHILPAQYLYDIVDSFVPLLPPESDPISPFLDLPELRGFWPMSSFDNNGAAYDLSGQGRTLTNINGAARGVFGGLIPYVAFNGTTQYLSRADEAGLQIAGALTFGGWFLTTSTARQLLISKSDGSTPGTNYWLEVNNGVVSHYISTGAAFTIVSSAAGAMPVSSWVFCVGRFTPSAEGAVFTNGVKVTTGAGIPASLPNSAQPLNIGSYGAGSGIFLAGNAALGFLCAAALSDALIGAAFQATRSLFGV